MSPYLIVRQMGIAGKPVQIGGGPGRPSLDLSGNRWFGTLVTSLDQFSLKDCSQSQVDVMLRCCRVVWELEVAFVGGIRRLLQLKFTGLLCGGEVGTSLLFGA